MTAHHMGPTRPFPRIPLDDWRRDAACAGHEDPTMWDASPDTHEGEHNRASRQAIAKNICRTQCPVRKECAESVDPRFDEGVRGGHVLPLLIATAKSSNTSARDKQLMRLLRAGVPLDEAVRKVQSESRNRRSA